MTSPAAAPRFLMSDKPPPVVLASASGARRQLLAAAGVEFAVLPARIDEEAVKASLKAERKSADEAATTLAELKALSVSARVPGALVIGADQMLSCNGQWFDKPPDRDHAFAQLRALAGKRHTLHAAVCLARDEAILMHRVERAHLAMRPLSDAFIGRYLDAAGDSVLDSVGAYQLEGLGAQLFERIDGDYFTILGLPLLPLLDILRAHGVLPA